MTSVANLTSGGGSANTSFATASVTPTANRLVLVAVHAYISTGSVAPAAPTVTGNGMSGGYTLVTQQDVDNSGVDRAVIFLYRGVTASPSAGAVTISFGAVTMTRCSWSVDQSDADIDLSGGAGRGAIAQSVIATTAGATSLSVNYSPAMRSDSAGYSVWGHQVTEVKTPRSAWTELSDVTVVTLSCIEAQMISGTDTAASASWATSSRAGGIAIEIKKAAPFIWVGGYGLQGGTTSLTMIPPSGTVAGDLEILWVANKNSSVDPTDPSGGSSGTWIRRGTFEVGTGADGVGTGKIRLTVWYRVLIAANSNTTVTITGANRALGGGQVYHLTGAGTWAVPSVEFGSDTDASTTAFAAVMATDLVAKVDEYLLSVGVFTANTTLPGRSLTVPNWTQSRLDNIDSGGGATGNQIFAWTDQRVGMVGTQSGASTTGATSGVGTTGGAVQVKIGLTTGQTATVGQAASTATATAVGRQKLKAVGQAASTATATALARTKLRAVGQALSTATGRAVTPAATRLVGRATAMNTATTVARSKARGVVAAVETASGTLVTPRRAKAVQAALETATATALTRTKRRAVGQALETDTGTATARRKTRIVGQAAESGTAVSVIRPGQVARASENDTATGLVKAKRRTVGQAAEVDTGGGTVTRRKTLAVGQAVSTATGSPIVHRKTKALGQAVETAIASIIARSKRRAIGQAAEVDTAQLIKGAGQLEILGRATETAAAFAITYRLVTPRPIGAVTTVPDLGITPRPDGTVEPRP